MTVHRELLSAVQKALSRKDISGARAALESRLVDKVDRSTADYLYAQVEMLAGNNEQAEALFASAIHLNPDLTEARMALAGLLLTAKRYEEARDHLHAIIQCESDNAVAHRKLGVTLSHLGQSEQAAAAFKQALSLDPRDANAMFRLGLLTAADRDHQTAIDWFSNCVAVAPQHTEALLRKGVSLQAIAAIDAAIDCYRQTLRLDPSLYYRVAKNLVSGPHGVFWLRGSDLRRELLESDR